MTYSLDACMGMLRYWRKERMAAISRQRRASRDIDRCIERQLHWARKARAVIYSASIAPTDGDDNA